MYYILFYHTIDDYVEKRKPYRGEHIKLLKIELQKKHVILGGALNDPADQAVIIWQVNDKKIIEDFVASDPYVKNGLISKYEIRSWNVVIDNR